MSRFWLCIAKIISKKCEFAISISNEISRRNGIYIQSTSCVISRTRLYKVCLFAFNLHITVTFIMQASAIYWWFFNLFWLRTKVFLIVCPNCTRWRLKLLAIATNIQIGSYWKRTVTRLILLVTVRITAFENVVITHFLVVIVVNSAIM